MQALDVTGKLRSQGSWTLLARFADLNTSIGCRSFHATGITEYLRNGEKLEIAQQMANHESARTTGLYDRRTD